MDASTLRDPQTDEERVKEPEWLVILGRSSCVRRPFVILGRSYIEFVFLGKKSLVDHNSNHCRSGFIESGYGSGSSILSESVPDDLDTVPYMNTDPVPDMDPDPGS